MQKRRSAGPGTIVVKFTGSTGTAAAPAAAVTTGTGRRTSGPGTIVVKFTGNNA
ncbi:MULTISPECIES: hypothetical protein [Streptomyces]|uniref:Uncharacterized protein n=2 Tax=Streptomyces TaxID=1883 RepID=A0A0B5EW55_STRA4|nr:MULTISPECIES: hypothetical protein [Streptomyces]AJE86024.1 hypothetical protein SLNWT_5648 [Streptomyces albus]AOU80326.1 hypothetical protein SLNHY_5635 [Streptomyces albus]AYN36037.1 hypothetical protein DUI70_5542 [Streptomyces albus]NKI42929.1 hypothetical protein [Streptomyces physcomitrii]